MTTAKPGLESVMPKSAQALVSRPGLSRAGGLVTLAIAGAGLAGLATTTRVTAAPDAALPVACAPDNGGLTLPPGFCATVFADHLGHARHLAVAADGTVYVNTWHSEDYFPKGSTPAGGLIVALKDRDGDGVADVIERFGPALARGGNGGTGIALWHGALYAEETGTIVRYAMQPGQMAPAGPAQIVLSGLVLGGDHPMHPFVIDGAGTLLVNSGSATNTCESPNRQPGAKGADPCIEQQTRGGIWAYRADQLGQRFSAAERWATGIRNTGGMAFDSAGRLFATQHGRDQLSQNWPALYTAEQGIELPSEILFSPTRGADFGWPTCYFDGPQGRHVLAPEYGGDGGHTQGRCAGKTLPVVAFPGHWAPNDVAIYTARAFPAAYAEGAFIAFHGSWNRAPAPQGGYQVVFQPLKDGKPAGAWIRFADGFAGAYREPGRAAHRPAGLAVGPDGALYIADDVRGTIWRVTYRGPADTPLVPAPEAAIKSALTVGDAFSGAPPVAPPGSSAEEVALGQRIYFGEARGGTCAGCHGSDGRGSAAGASLVGPGYLWSDGSPAGLAATITAGVAHPKKGGGGMPALGGVPLDAHDVKAVAAYVWTLGHHAG
jgi:glucose/arabinose dehydrogenase